MDIVYTFQSGLRESRVSYNPCLRGGDDMNVRGDEVFQLITIFVSCNRSRNLQ